MTTSVPTVQLPSSINFWDKEGVPKFNVGATSPLPYPIRWNFYVCSKYLARSNSVPTFSIVSTCIVQLCEYVFPIGFPLYEPQNGVFGGFEDEDVKILSSNPKRHYVAWIRVCWCITHSLTAALDQLRVVASSTSNDPGPRSRQHQTLQIEWTTAFTLVPWTLVT